MENVFDYFATSMFYDKQSSNQVLRMQTIHSGQPPANEVEELRRISLYLSSRHHPHIISSLILALFYSPLRLFRRFTGIEFALVHAQPPSLFIIHKRERLSPDEGSRIFARLFHMSYVLIRVV